jgi:hypothetical protein
MSLAGVAMHARSDTPLRARKFECDSPAMLGHLQPQPRLGAVSERDIPISEPFLREISGQTVPDRIAMNNSPALRHGSDTIPAGRGALPAREQGIRERMVKGERGLRPHSCVFGSSRAADQSGRHVKRVIRGVPVVSARSMPHQRRWRMTDGGYAGWR